MQEDSHRSKLKKDRYVSRYTVRYPGREAGIIPEVVTVGEVTRGSGCERGHREISGSKLKVKCVKRSRPVFIPMGVTVGEVTEKNVVSRQ